MPVLSRRVQIPLTGGRVHPLLYRRVFLIGNCCTFERPQVCLLENFRGLQRLVSLDSLHLDSLHILRLHHVCPLAERVQWMGIKEA